MMKFFTLFLLSTLCSMSICMEKESTDVIQKIEKDWSLEDEKKLIAGNLSTFHCLVGSLIHNNKWCSESPFIDTFKLPKEFNKETYDTIFNILIKKECDINYLSESWQERTPLAVYFINYNSHREKLPEAFQVIELFFKHGARILTHNEENRCNLLHTILQFANHRGSAYITPIIGTVLVERAKISKEAKESCELYCLLFYRLNKGKEGYPKFPRVLRDVIIDMIIPNFKKVIADDITDIKSSLLERDNWGYGGKGRTPLEFVMRNKDLNKDTSLCQMLNPTFWDQPLKEVIPQVKRWVLQSMEKKN